MIKKLLFTLLLLTLPFTCFGANRYWVGNSGNWNDTAHWSASSGGGGGETAPGASDNAFVDANSLSATSTITINVAASVVDLIVTGLDNILNLILSNNITTSGTFQIDGLNAAIGRTLIKSNGLGTSRTITAATVSVTNVDFQDITGAGVGSWDISGATGGSGDAGGNTDITFTTADIMYWHVDVGSWSDSAKWFLATNGGGGSGRVPLPQDDIVFDANSFDSGAQTVTQDMPRAGKSINWTGSTNTPTWTFSVGHRFYGSITLIAAMNTNFNRDTYWEGRGVFTLTSAGHDWGNFKGYMVGGKLTLQDALVMGYNRGWTWFYGEFDANDFNVTSQTISSNSSSIRIVTMGNGTWINLDSSLCDWRGITNLTLNPEGSTIIWSNGGNIWLNTLTWNNMTFDGGSPSLRGSITVNVFTLIKDTSITFEHNKTFTVSSFVAVGDAVDGIIITSQDGSNTFTLTDSAGENKVEYCDISYSTAEGGADWIASVDDGNTDSGNNTGWNFASDVARRIILTKRKNALWSIQ